MKNLKRKYFVAFLFPIYISGIIGIFSSFILEFHRISFQSSLQNIPSAKEETFFFSIEEFKKINWEEAGEEFELNNKMYDVSKIITCKNGFKVFCVNDSEEESLMAMINQWKQSSSQSKIKLFQPQFCTDIDSEQVSFVSTNTQFLTEYLFCFESLKRSITSPPPELA